MKHFTALFIIAYLALCGIASAQTAVLRKTLSTNAITEGFTLPSGQTLTVASGGTLVISGTTTLADDVKITFNPGTTFAGFNVGAIAGDPSTLANGDLWYDSTANELTARINGANVALGAGGGGGTPGGSTTQLQYNNAGAFGGMSGWTTNGTTTLVGGASTTLSIGGGTAITSSTKLAAIESLANGAGVLTNDGAGVFSYTAESLGGNGAADDGKLVVYGPSGDIIGTGQLYVQGATGHAYLLGDGGIVFSNQNGFGGAAQISTALLTQSLLINLPDNGNANLVFAVRATSPIMLNATSGELTLSTVPVASGGTNVTSYTTGDMLYASGTTALSKLAAVAIGSVLTSAGTSTAPAWSSAPQITSINLGHATDTTIARVSAGLISVEGGNVPLENRANTFTAAQIVTVAAAVSTSGIKVDGTWSTAGTTTTDKPSLLIEPAGTTSTGWDTNGTGLGVNAATGFTGQLLDLQLAGATKFKVSSAGSVMLPNTNQPMIGTADGTNIYYHSTGILFQLVGTNFAKFVPGNGLNMGTNYFGGSSSVFDGTMDTGLIRDGAAGVLALKNATNQMKFRVYGTTTSSKYTEVTHNGTNAIITDNGTGIIIRTGAGTPEASITAPVGSLYLRSDGGASTTLYIKESGSGNTGWIAK
jgi:hypothetical protein